MAVLANLDILSVRSHVDDLDPEAGDPKRPWLFSRDCLEVVVELPTGQPLTLLINHLKSKFVDPHQAKTLKQKKAKRKKDDAHRQRQAERLIAILQERFPGNAFQTELFAVVGDMNDEPRSEPLKKLFNNVGLEEALGRIPTAGSLDPLVPRRELRVPARCLAAVPALSQATTGGAPVIERRGISFARVLQDGGIGPKKSHFQRVDDDPNPVEVDFRFPRFNDAVQHPTPPHNRPGEKSC